ncbi:hypothetical protein JCM9140_856 [Halalkalibacter wakoensis JCM 9140]|uniref:Uncharacterized protein n=1 Tax=Halalkalibacter wakoensis JCM 9140 TaxID=1236970 RepID=W4PZJ0_9BACI|nr:DUF4198 domain-containing protein [Halalkalibacter wakoensis]GAE24893.1 hypothetical protein JCM9140_856 [Halalkalibacter wakoensis JCM 9140]
MKNTMLILLFAVCCFLFLFPSNISAHELFIQVEENETEQELRVDVLWGHLRDFLDEANHDQYELFVRYPNGDTDQLSIESIGVHAVSYVPITEEGAYTFWAVRKPSTYTPDSGITQLSNQMAKAIHYIGENSSNSNQPIDLNLEIVPAGDTSNFTTGNFESIILLDGVEVSDATVTAYGPEGEILEGASDQNGRIELNLDSSGEWLLKANVRTEETGMLEDEEYEVISQTSTLLIDTSETNEASSTNIWTLAAMFFIGLFIGAAIILLTVKRKSRAI